MMKPEYFSPYKTKATASAITLFLRFFMMTEARWMADKILYFVLFSKRSIVMKLPVKRAPSFSVYNWQVASCEL